jgi:hypothetical protein
MYEVIPVILGSCAAILFIITHHFMFKKVFFGVFLLCAGVLSTLISDEFEMTWLFVFVDIGTSTLTFMIAIKLLPVAVKRCIQFISDFRLPYN